MVSSFLIESISTCNANYKATRCPRSRVQGITPSLWKGSVLLLSAASRIVTLMFLLLTQTGRLFCASRRSMAQKLVILLFDYNVGGKETIWSTSSPWYACFKNLKNYQILPSFWSYSHSGRQIAPSITITPNLPKARVYQPFCPDKET